MHCGLLFCSSTREVIEGLPMYTATMLPPCCHIARTLMTWCAAESVVDSLQELQVLQHRQAWFLLGVHCSCPTAHWTVMGVTATVAQRVGKRNWVVCGDWTSPLVAPGLCWWRAYQGSWMLLCGTSTESLLIFQLMGWIMLPHPQTVYMLKS